jgi:DNA-binding protein YbaB
MYIILGLVILVNIVAFKVQTRLAKSSTALMLFGNPDDKPTPTEKKNSGGMFGGMGNLMESMKKAQEIAKQAEVVNKELGATEVSGSDASGGVISKYNGLGVPISMTVSDSIASKGAEAVSKACTEAMLDGHTKAQEAMMARMQAMYQGSGMPMPPQ